MLNKLISLILGVILLSSVVVCNVGCSKAKSSVVVKDGVSNYCLLLPEEQTEINELIAEEFSFFVQQSTGVEMQVLYGNVTDEIEHFISFGETELYKQKNISVDLLALGDDGFAIKCIDGDFFVIGNTERAILWGAYELIERYVGVRFLSQEYVHIPKLNEIKFECKDFICVPEFEQRDFIFYSSLETKYRMRTYGSQNYSSVIGTSWATELGNCHTILNYVQPSLYKEEHPEFFASYTNDTAKTHVEDVCWSNGITDDGKIDETKDISVAKIIINRIIEYLKTNGYRKFFMLGINDWLDTYCKCDVCERRLQVVGERSGITTMLCNAVVDAVNDWILLDGKEYGVNNEVNVVQFAYYWTEQAPVHKEGDIWVANSTLAIPNKNVYVRVAPLNANFAYSYSDSRQHSKYTNLIESWASITDNLMIYDYCLKIELHTAWLPHLSYIQEKARYLKEKNFYHWFLQSLLYLDGIGVYYINLFSYVLQNLWWNVDVNVDELIDEFVELYHGQAAAPYIKQFIQLMENNNERLRNTEGYFCGVFTTYDISSTSYPVELIEEATFLLNQAITATENDNTLDEDKKEILITHTTEALLIPQSIVLYNYGQYYFIATKKKYVEDFRKNATRVGIKMMSGETQRLTVDQWLDALG